MTNHRSSMHSVQKKVFLKSTKKCAKKVLIEAFYHVLQCATCLLSLKTVLHSKAKV